MSCPLRPGGKRCFGHAGTAGGHLTGWQHFNGSDVDVVENMFYLQVVLRRFPDSRLVCLRTSFSERYRAILMKKNATFIILLLLVIFCTRQAAAGDTDTKKPSVPGIAIGLGCMAGGTLFSVYNYARGKAQYEVYRKSAFTDNTSELHREVKRRDLFCILGAVAAGAGLFTVVVSF